jgi:hypothetical protein
MIENLTNKNIYAYMINSYDNPQCIDFEEFEEDTKVPKYIKRLINRYLFTGELKERLILNHVISFYNVFTAEAATRILFFKVKKEDYSILKTFLVYLNLMPDQIVLIDGITLYSVNIPISIDVANQLRNL